MDSSESAPPPAKRLKTDGFLFPATLNLQDVKKSGSLKPLESKLWLHGKRAAETAANFYSPVHQYRKLGVITRHLQSNRSTLPSLSKRKAAVLPERKNKPSMAISAYKKLAAADAIRENVTKTDAQLTLDANELKIAWDKATKTRLNPIWDEKGELLDLDHLTPASNILKWMRSGLLSDAFPKRTVAINDYMNVPVDTLSVLRALVDLSKLDENFYSVPLVASYPVLTKDDSSSGGFKLQIGVYASRLLFEVMTTGLKTIMAALDDFSYQIVRPLATLPLAEDVFASDNVEITYTPPTQSDTDVLLRQSQVEQDSIFAFSNAGYLKLIESHGCNIDVFPKLESVLHSSLKVKLMLHQVHGLCWMYQMEHLEDGLNSLLWEKRQFQEGGTFYYSPALGQARLFLGEQHLPPPHLKGGMLCDEMGLGKTIMTLSLIVATLDELKEEAKLHDGSHTTLIIVPPALVSQWLVEIEKVTGDSLAYEFFNHHTCEFERHGRAEGEADIVVTTYNALDKQLGKSGNRKAASILTSEPWGRVVLDEFQEIRSSTTHIAKACAKLECDRRWMLSGTPLYEGVEDLRGELCFLQLEPFAGNCEDGFFDFAVKSHWEAHSQTGLEMLRVLSNFILRRSKSMTIKATGHPILGLKPMTIEYTPVAQDRSERALYCFLEYLVHATIRHEDKEDDSKNRSLLRMLREMCISPLLLNGGMGCPSQLSSLNHLLVLLNRKECSEIPVSAQLSCDQAIKYLSQVLTSARVEEGFATDMTMGAGGGISRRDRATESVEQLFKDAETKLKESSRKVQKVRSDRAKLNWHKLLERVTTGKLNACEYARASRKFRVLWQFRSILGRIMMHGGSEHGLPIMLTRGWRPDVNMFRTESSDRAKTRWQSALLRILNGELAEAGPVELLSKGQRSIRAAWKWRFIFSKRAPRINELVYTLSFNRRVQSLLSLKWLSSRQTSLRWAHPFCYLLDKIPKEVDVLSLRKAVSSVVAKSKISKWGGFETSPIGTTSDGTWAAYIQFKMMSDFKAFGAMVKRVNGAKLLDGNGIPGVQTEIEETKAALDEAIAECTVYECDVNIEKKKAAEKAHKYATQGLRILSKERHRGCHVICTPALASLRDVTPKLSSTLFSSVEYAVKRATETIVVEELKQVNEEQTMKRLKASMRRPGLSAAMHTSSAFDTLLALDNGQQENTQCAVCLGSLGEEESSRGLVALTPCGHLFCRGCYQDYHRGKVGEGRHEVPCISCRKPVTSKEIRIVDPSRRDDRDALEVRRQEAKKAVQEAAAAMQETNGLLKPELWEKLYLSFDPPSDVDGSLHNVHTAIPREFLMHLRHASTLDVDCGSRALVRGLTDLSSKIRALLHDIPRNERSVVFTSSQKSVQLLQKVFTMAKIGYRALYTGQKETQSETALEDWKSEKLLAPVLIVQSGAAACGLTLTAASKMFILEPFLKHEEEKQAYARLHRYGQTKEVVCKIYYAPVSVESRLLEWRKQAGNGTASGQMTVLYASLEDDEEMEEEVAEEDQTRFLLGLNTNGETKSVADTMDLTVSDSESALGSDV